MRALPIVACPFPGNRVDRLSGAASCYGRGPVTKPNGTYSRSGPKTKKPNTLAPCCGRPSPRLGSTLPRESVQLYRQRHPESVLGIDLKRTQATRRAVSDPAVIVAGLRPCGWRTDLRTMASGGDLFGLPGLFNQLARFQIDIPKRKLAKTVLSCE